MWQQPEQDPTITAAGTLDHDVFAGTTEAPSASQTGSAMKSWSSVRLPLPATRHIAIAAALIGALTLTILFANVILNSLPLLLALTALAGLATTAQLKEHR